MKVKSPIISPEQSTSSKAPSWSFASVEFMPWKGLPETLKKIIGQLGKVLTTFVRVHDLIAKTGDRPSIPYSTNPPASDKANSANAISVTAPLDSLHNIDTYDRLLSWVMQQGAAGLCGTGTAADGSGGVTQAGHEPE
jgi:hypothetical protein